MAKTKKAKAVLSKGGSKATKKAAVDKAKAYHKKQGLTRLKGVDWVTSAKTYKGKKVDLSKK